MSDESDRWIRRLKLVEWRAEFAAEVLRGEHDGLRSGGARPWPSSPGERVEFSVMWDHCMADPRAVYRVSLDEPWWHRVFAGIADDGVRPALVNHPDDGKACRVFTSDPNTRGVSGNRLWLCEFVGLDAPRPDTEQRAFTAADVAIGDTVTVEWPGPDSRRKGVCDGKREDAGHAGAVSLAGMPGWWSYETIVDVKPASEVKS